MASWKDNYRVGQAVNVRSTSADSTEWLAAKIVKLSPRGTLLVRFCESDMVMQVTRKDDICVGVEGGGALPKKRDTSDKPYVENYPALAGWLAEIGTSCLWRLPLGPPTKPDAYVECHVSSGGDVFIVIVRARRMGFDIFTSIPSLSIDETLKDANARVRRTT